MGNLDIERSLAGIAVCLALAGSAAAGEAAPDEPSRAELLEIIRKLERRVDELERKATQAPAAAPAPTAPAAAAQPAAAPGPTGAPMDVGTPAAPGAPGAPASALADALKKIAFSGYTEVLYSQNLRPGGSVPGKRGDALNYNQLRGPDNDADAFSFQNFEILADKPLEGAGSTGFRTRVAYGRIGEIANIDPNTATGDTLAVIDANFSWRTPCAPFDDAGFVDLSAGKFRTPLGLETLENVDNWVVTRNPITVFGTPVTHTGVRAAVPFSSTATANVYFVNGWDNTRDETDGKTAIGNLVLGRYDTLSSQIQLNASYGTASTTDADQGDKQRFLEAIWDGRFSDDTEFAVDAIAGDGEDRRWRGVAGLLRQRLGPKTTLSGRVGWYGDDILAPERTRILDLTLALAWEAAEGLILSLEYRHDASGNDVYLNGSGDPTDHQDTVTASFLYRF